MSGATIFGGQGADIITATTSAAIVGGDKGADRITTGAGNDTIFGGEGADVIITGTGVDVVTMGAGVDTITNTGTTDKGTTGASNIAAADVVTLTNQAVVSDFVVGAGGDRATMTNATFGGAALGALANGATYAIAGTYSATASTFTVGATTATGNDTMLVSVSGADIDNDIVVLTGVNASTVTALNIV